MTPAFWGKRSVQISVSGRSHPGRVRPHNEDRFLIADISRERLSANGDLEEYGLGRGGSLLLVADGMGGAAAGEVASEMAADVIYRGIVDAGAQNGRKAIRFLRASVEAANREINEYSAAHPELSGMGCTATAACVLGDEVFVAQVGDSRAYLVRAGTITQITRDQSLTQRLVDDSRMTEEEAQRSERRNVILQALGPSPDVEVVVIRQELRAGDVLVLCSDGLSGPVSNEEIGQIVVSTRDLGVACDDLVELANSRGGRDNITVVIARVDGSGLKEPGSSDPVAPEMV